MAAQRKVTEKRINPIVQERVSELKYSLVLVVLHGTTMGKLPQAGLALNLLLDRDNLKIWNYFCLEIY